MRKLSQQSKLLRKHMFKRFVVGFIIYVLAFFALYAVFDTFISPALGDFIADHTSEWHYRTLAEDNEAPADESLGHYIQYGDGPLADDSDPNNTVVKYRYLDTYMFLKQIKDAAIPVAFALGIAILIYVVMNRFVCYFDELSTGIAVLLEDKNAHVELSKDLSIVRDELERIRNESLQNEKKARVAEQRKNELVAFMAHDIRTPLTSAKGYLSLLRKNKPIERGQRIRYADIAYERIEKLEQYTDELFELTTLNAQAFTLNPCEVRLQMFCMQIADEMLPLAMQRGLSIETNVPNDATCIIDSDCMVRALSNILRNAIAYADDGSTVTFGGHVNGNSCVFTICNTGIGIAPENTERVFEKFFREDIARNSDTGGAGLGLAIAKEIVEAHGGTIKATSTPTSTAFTLTIPSCVQV